LGGWTRQQEGQNPTSCSVEVKKPFGLKKPVSQKEFGRPLVSHVVS
jgi:hypothetical protein